MCGTARETASALFLEQRIYSLFIDITRLKYDKNVIFTSLQDFCRSTKMAMPSSADVLTPAKNLRDGCTIVKIVRGQPRYIVLYNTDQRNPRRRAFTLAHEIGHIYLGHQDDRAENETQANHFASELLMPECLLREYVAMNGNKASSPELCQIFNISLAAASLRLRAVIHRAAAHSESLIQNDYDAAIIRKFSGLLPLPEGPIVTI